MVARLIIAIAAIAMMPIGGDATERRMTVEESLALRQIGSIAISPDGTRIAYAVSNWDRAGNRRVSHLHVISVETGRSFQLTNGEKGETAPQWSPDGTRIGFLADRGKGAQVWTIPADGGEAQPLTSEEAPVEGFQWAPDSLSIVFLVRDHATDPKEKEAQEKRRRERFDTIVIDADLRYTHLWKLEISSRAKTRLTAGNFSVQSAAWSPNGTSIVYAASPAGAQESVFTDISNDRNSDLFLIPSSGGTARQLTSNPGPDSNPLWSPDGQWIAYTSNSTAWIGKTDLLVIRANGGDPRNLTAQTIESVGPSFLWEAGNRLLFSSAVGVHTHLFTVSLDSDGVIARKQGPSHHAQFDVARSGQLLAYTSTNSRAEPNLWVEVGKGAEPRQLTDLNPQLREVSLAETELVSWKGPDNFTIEGLLMRPVGYQIGQRVPLILMIHGGPYGRFIDVFQERAQIFAAQGYAVLSPNPRGSTGYGTRFMEANLADWGGKDFADLMAGVDTMIARGLADPEKLVVMGGSYGGFMTFWTITQTSRFKAAIGHAAISDWYSFHGQSDIPGLMEVGFGGTPWEVPENYRRWSPMTHVAKVRTPILITHGERDFRVNIQQGEQYYRSLRKRGVETVFLRYPREGHGIQEPNHIIDLVGRQLAWFDRHLGIKREPAPPSTEKPATPQKD
ncbi:MAG: S9 family peptidase [Blastocatellia bacterium]